jgi:hypothetical protein
VTGKTFGGAFLSSAAGFSLLHAVIVDTIATTIKGFIHLILSSFVLVQPQGAKFAPMEADRKLLLKL